jgi:hypothetical protein
MRCASLDVAPCDLVNVTRHVSSEIGVSHHVVIASCGRCVAVSLCAVSRSSLGTHAGTRVPRAVLASGVDARVCLSCDMSCDLSCVACATDVPHV